MKLSKNILIINTLCTDSVKAAVRKAKLGQTVRVPALLVNKELSIPGKVMDIYIG